MEYLTDLAIIGYGYMGRIYKKACLELSCQKRVETYYKHDFPGLIKGFSLKAIVDTKFTESSYDDEEDIWYFNSIKSMFACKETTVNAVVLSTPIGSHFALARTLVSHDISVLIEKPVCETAAEVKELMTLAEQKGVRILPGHVERYNPVTLDAVEAVTYRMYGDVTSYRFSRCSTKPERVKAGLITDKLIHDLDLVGCIFGSFKIRDISLKKMNGEIMECRVKTGHEAFEGEIISSWMHDKKERLLDIYFERASFCGDLIEKKIDIDRYHELSKQISGYQNNQIRDELVDFIAGKHKLIKTLVNMQDALNSAYLIDEIYRRIPREI